MTGDLPIWAKTLPDTFDGCGHADRSLEKDTPNKSSANEKQAKPMQKHLYFITSPIKNHLFLSSSRNSRLSVCFKGNKGGWLSCTMDQHKGLSGGPRQEFLGCNQAKWQGKLAIHVAPKFAQSMKRAWF